MPSWAVIQHVHHEPAALIGTLAAQRGITLDVRVIPNGGHLFLLTHARELAPVVEEFLAG